MFGSDKKGLKIASLEFELKCNRDAVDQLRQRNAALEDELRLLREEANRPAREAFDDRQKHLKDSAHAAAAWLADVASGKDKKPVNSTRLTAAIFLVKYVLGDRPTEFRPVEYSVSIGTNRSSAFAAMMDGMKWGTNGG